MSDPRFVRLKTDPRFRKPRKAQNKVVVDSRFKSLLGEGDEGTNHKGKTARIDKYGRKIPKNQDKENLRRFYHLQDDEETALDTKPTAVIDYARGEALMESSSEEDEEEEDSNTEEVTVGRGLSQLVAKPGPSKKITELLDVDLDESSFADLDAQARVYSSTVTSEQEPAARPTSRIAAVNLDWDYVTAAHLFRVMTSVLPSEGPGKVLSVAVYPSDFGRERMEREEKEGPPKELFKKGRGARIDEVDSDEEVNAQTIFSTQDGDDYDDDALRQYQLDRLRYYYAVITCNSASAASYIYDELEGTELERSANIFDLSYVPNDMEFIQECRDECTSELQAPRKGMDFVTDALRHSKVKLSWDGDDPERSKITRRRMTRKEVDEGDFRALLASSSEDEGEGEDAESRRNRVRALLLSGNTDDLPEGWGNGNDEKGTDLEITFMPALSSEAPKEAEDETTLDRYKRKQKEKKARRKAKHEQESLKAPDRESSDDNSIEENVSRKVQEGASSAQRRATADAELALVLTPDPDGQESAEPKHFDMRTVLKAEKAKRSRKKGSRKARTDTEGRAEDGQGFEMDVKDERFSALHEDHEFAIDPSNPHFTKTKSMRALLDERARRQRGREGPKEHGKYRQEGNDRSLDTIVESVKRKSGDIPLVGKRQKL